MEWTKALSGWWSVWSETFTGHPDRRTSRKVSSALFTLRMDFEFLLEDTLCKPGADNSPLFAVTLEPFGFLPLGVHYRRCVMVFFYHQASFQMCFEWTSLCSACYTLWSGVIISSSSCVSSCLSLQCRLELHWLSVTLHCDHKSTETSVLT